MRKMVLVIAAMAALASPAARADTVENIVKACQKAYGSDRAGAEACANDLLKQVSARRRPRAPEVIVVPQADPRPTQTFCEPVFGQPGQVACQSY